MSFNKNLGGDLYRIIFLTIFLVGFNFLLKHFGASIFFKPNFELIAEIALAIIGYAVYSLVGALLRGLGIWRY